MENLFKNTENTALCQKSGICFLNPVLSAIEAVIINEIWQMAFYIVRLKELNFMDTELLKTPVEALCVSFYDTNFNKKKLLKFYEELNNKKMEIKNLYIKKSKQMNISYEFITPVFAKNKENIETVDIIKGGENILRQFYNSFGEEKIRLIKLLILICKTSALNLIRLKEFKFEYYFEILRLLSLTNSMGAREEKYIRRIKEFSKTAFEIQNELNIELVKKYGEREGGIIDTSVYKGKSVLYMGDNTDELYFLLNAVNLNVYLSIHAAIALSYPVFKEFKNLKGVYGTEEAEIDFANFKGPVFVGKNAAISLDNIFQGKIYTTKTVPPDGAILINNGDFSLLEENTGGGFEEDKQGKVYKFEYRKEILKTDNPVLIAIGPLNDKIREKFNKSQIINFVFPNETEGLYFALENLNPDKTEVLFTECGLNTVNTVISLFCRNLAGIYIKGCTNSSLNPHISDSLEKDFNIKFVTC